MIFKEASILGTWLANATFPKAVKILESGVLNLKELVTHTLPLEKLEEGVALLKKGEGFEVHHRYEDVALVRGAVRWNMLFWGKIKFR